LSSILILITKKEFPYLNFSTERTVSFVDLDRQKGLSRADFGRSHKGPIIETRQRFFALQFNSELKFSRELE